MSQPEFGIFHRAMVDGPIVRGGLGMILCAGALFLVWVFLAVRRRRAFPWLGGTVIGLLVVGYLAFEWRHISLNLSMRDAQSVRDDCERLLQLRKTTVPGEGYSMSVRNGEIPASLTRVGAKFVCITANNVEISLIPESGLTGREWGFLYDPKRAYLEDGALAGIRPTWYRDFYEFRLLGE